MPEYHFKLVWNEGSVASDVVKDQDYALEWKQSHNPLIAHASDMIVMEPRLIPSNNVPPMFNGLSLSSSSFRLLDGHSGMGPWWYGVGYRRNHGGGNPAYIYQSGTGGKVAADRTQLFVNVSGLHYVNSKLQLLYPILKNAKLPTELPHELLTKKY